MQVHDVLEQKQRPVYSIAADQTVEDAITEMTAKRVSALIVTEADDPVGIFAERDVFQCYIRDRNRRFSEIKVTETMSRKLIVAETTDEISAAMAMMIQADIKHLPVIKGRKVIAMLTLSDLVKHQIGELTAEVHYLKDYIDDLHDAIQD